MSKETTFFTNEELKEKMEANNYQQNSSQMFYFPNAEDMKASQIAREKTQEIHEQMEQISEIWYC